MASIRGVWGIDIGNSSLKAIRLRSVAEGLEVIGFDFIEHSQVLSGDGVDQEQRRQIIDETLRQFTGRNDFKNDEVAISIAGQSGFARFIKLPPVEPKGIPKIVQYEAIQQIPFDINEVEWDWQIMEDPDSPDTEVGIFAVKNEIVSGVLEPFTRENMRVACVQISPIALYNYAICDRNDIGGSNGKATVILDMGADSTTLVVCTQTNVWQRTIRIGGNAFTEAVGAAFKLGFERAEKLKRTAPMSKYVRQIFTAMKPVFTDLSSEIQRSLGFYDSSGPGKGKGFSKVIALGGGMKLQGLAKYLQQSIGVPVIKPDSFEQLKIGSEVSTAKFHENVSDFGVVYGLAAQLLGQAKIESNLLPRQIARAMAWTRKAKYFTIAASMVLAASVLSLGGAFHSRSQYNSAENAKSRQMIGGAISMASQAESDLQAQKDRDGPLDEKIDKQMELFKYRHIVPLVNETIISCLANAQNNPDQKLLYEAFENGDVGTVISFPRAERKQLFVTSISVDYSEHLETAKFGASRKKAQRSRSVGMMDMGMMDMGMEMGGPDDYSPSYESPQTDEKTDHGGPGFLVVIEGYSPYANIDELLDPARVGGNRSKWGFVTRLANLDTFLPDGKFKLFGKDDVTHFKQETGEVEFSSGKTPAGIGVEKVIERIPSTEEKTGRAGTTRVTGRGADYVSVESVLIDPMTKEEMSKTFDLVRQAEIDSNPNLSERDLGKKKYTDFDEVEYIVRDHWFRISAKLLWKGAPSLEDK